MVLTQAPSTIGQAASRPQQLSLSWGRGGEEEGLGVKLACGSRSVISWSAQGTPAVSQHVLVIFELAAKGVSLRVPNTFLTLLQLHKLVLENANQ